MSSGCGTPTATRQRARASSGGRTPSGEAGGPARQTAWTALVTLPPTIGIGSTETAFVVAAQRCLNAADAREQSAGRTGLSTCPLTEDGQFGSQTEQAAIDFQVLNSLNPDGIIGPNTWPLLLEVVNPASGIASGAALPLEG